MSALLRKQKAKPSPFQRGRPQAYAEWFDLAPGKFVITYPWRKAQTIRVSVRNYTRRYGLKLKTWKTAAGEIAVERLK